MSSRFQESYLEGSPPWDIGRPQGEFVRLTDRGAIDGTVLDSGCGTGENALYLAQHGLNVVGLDGAPAAIEQARRKASERHIAARFEVADVLDLSRWNQGFDSVIDSGWFHVFDDVERARYVTSLHGALRPGGHVHLCCFSDREPGDWGPRRVTQTELREAFSEGWRVDGIHEAHFETTLGAELIEAWLATVSRL